MAGHSSVMLGWSLTDFYVSGSQFFGKSLSGLLCKAYMFVRWMPNWLDENAWYV